MVPARAVFNVTDFISASCGSRLFVYKDVCKKRVRDGDFLKIVRPTVILIVRPLKMTEEHLQENQTYTEHHAPCAGQSIGQREYTLLCGACQGSNGGQMWVVKCVCKCVRPGNRLPAQTGRSRRLGRSVLEDSSWH